MTRRKTRNAKKPATQQPEAVVDPKQEVGSTSEAEAGVGVDSGSAVATAGAEHQGAANSAPVADDAGKVSDGTQLDVSEGKAPDDQAEEQEGKADPADQTVREESSAGVIACTPEPASGAEGTGDQGGLSERSGDTDLAAGGASGTAGVQSADHGSDAGNDGTDAVVAAGQGDDANGSADQASGAGSGEAALAAAQADTVLNDQGDFTVRQDPDDMIIHVAEEAAFHVVDYLGKLFPLSDEEHASVRKIAGYSDAGSLPTNSVAGLIRQIGADRATTSVLGQQLKIDGHLESGELSIAQALVVKIFAAVVIELDKFEAEYLRANRPKVEPDPRQAVPIDETNMELVDGPMDTWGR